MLLLPLLLGAPLWAQPALEGAAALSAQRAPSAFSAFYDGARRPSAVSASSYERLKQAKSLLAEGAGAVRPFTFRAPGGDYTAPAAGLEGFLYAEELLSASRGRAALLRHLDDYGRYLDALLAPVPWAAQARGQVRAILDSGGSPEARYEKLTSFARAYAETLRREVASSDKAAWARRARIYEIFPRAYNLAGKRRALGRPPGAGGRFFADFGTADLMDIKAQGFDTLWLMGVLPIGKRNAFGTAGGSPYSVSDHETVHPDLGTEGEFKEFVARAHRAGLKVIVDFIPNHTSMDSKLLSTHPEFFITMPAPEGRRLERGWFDHRDPGSGQALWVRHGGYDAWGQLDFWEDTAQVDYSNEATRREMVRIVRSWVSRFDVDGFRVDMAYQVLNRYFSRNWGRRMPPREFLEELTTSVKAAYPDTAFIAEAYDGWDELSAAGFDLIYGKNDMGREGGHKGWYDALASRDPGAIRAAVSRAEYLSRQKGGADMMDFVGNHDEAGPARAFGPWTKGASFLTVLLPTGMLFYGSQEIGYDQPDPREPKSIPFSVPRQVDWEHPDAELAAFYKDAFAASARLRQRLPEAELKALDPGPDCAGYSLSAPRAAASAAVLANPTDHSALCRADGFEAQLPPFGYRLLER